MMDIINEARKIADIAKKCGATEYEIYVSNGQSADVSAQDNNLHSATSDRSTSVGIRVINNNSLGFASINSLDEKKVAQAVQQAVSIAKLAPPDPHNVLPEPQPVVVPKDIFDEKLIDYPLSECIKQVQESIDSAKSYDKRISIESASFGTHITKDAIVTSKGIELTQNISYWVTFLMGMAIDGEKVSSFDFQFKGGTSALEIDLKEMRQLFNKSVVESLGATQGESFMGTVIVHPDTFLDIILSSIDFLASAEAIQTGASRFAGQLGKKVFSDCLTLTDDGTLAKRIRSKTFDREGITPKPIEVIKNGVFNEMLHNAKTAHRAGVATNGRAAGAASNPPRIEMTNVFVKPGEASLDDIIADTKQGLLVKRYSGNIDPPSGNFSGTVKGGWLIKNGKLDRPVSGTMIAGNLFDVLSNITAVSKDTIDLATTVLPYIRCEGVSVTSGK